MSTHVPRFRTLAVLLLSGIVGCHHTYRTERITDHACPFRGVPANVHRAYVAQVTWSKTDTATGHPFVTKHLCRLPVLYGVDIQKAPLGVTKGTFEMNDSGQLTKADGEIDEQIDELISSAAELANAVKPSVQRSSTDTNFTPDIGEMMGSEDGKLGYPIDIQFMEVL